MTAHTPACPKAFVLGHPISHSKSPLLHRAAYRVLGTDCLYSRLDTDASQLAAVFDRHGTADGTQGFSVTMPLKEAVLAHLDELTPFARAVGVVNTVYWRESATGRQAWGHNTDVSGIVNALRAAGFCGTSSKPAIIGGGGTATAALAALVYLGAGSVRVFVRDESRAQALRDAAKRLGVDLEFAPLGSYAQVCSDFDLTVCTLPAGAADTLLEGANRAKKPGILLDVSYDPWPSPLASDWEALGGTVTSGLEMLMYQAVDQVKLFTGYRLDERLPREQEVVAAMRQAVGLAPRDQLPEMVWDPGKLMRR